VSKGNKKEKTQPKLTRRQFLGVTAAAGTMAALSGCDVVDKIGGNDNWVPTQYRNSGNYPINVKGRVPIDPDNPSIMRIDEKCILCGQCIEVCQNIQTVHDFYKLPVLDTFMCINCGQCSLWCPTGAIQEHTYIDEVNEAINDPDKIVVVSISPGVRVSIGEEFGMEAGTWAQEQMVSAVRRLGADYVFNIDFSSDSTIMEEGSEFIHRLTNDGVLPQFTSCCPAWKKFVELYYPELIPNISTAKSPVAEMASLVKTYWAKKKGIDPSKIVYVNIPPCTCKKYEATIPNINAAKHYWNEHEGIDYGDIVDIDVVLSTRELARMIKTAGIDFLNLPDGEFDSMMSEGSGAAVIFANNGGVMEAAIRTAYYLVTGNDPPDELYHLTPVRDHDLDGYAEASLEVPGFGTLNVAVCNGLHAARTLCEEIKQGKRPELHFLEVMACPGGCIGGGGQARESVPPTDRVRMARINSIYAADEAMDKANRVSYKNKEIATLYKEFLGEPLSEMSEMILHATFIDRSKSVHPKDTSDYVDTYVLNLK
jgi:iron-only hydrogenase group A